MTAQDQRQCGFGPMVAVPGRLPVNKQGWAWEMKWDGVRALAVTGADGLTLFDGGGGSISGAYPDLSTLADDLGRRRIMLDGVISRDGARVCYRAFDVLSLDGHDLTGESYLVRRKLLTSLVPTDTPTIEVPPHYRGLSGPQLAQLARKHNATGIVGKRLSSRYHRGQHAGDWIELALLRGCEAVIGGWIPERGDEDDTLDSVLLGVYNQVHRLVYIGRVATGFTDTSRRALRSVLETISESDSPFATAIPRAHSRRAQWVRPVLIGDVNFRGIDTTGRLHRPSWRGTRTDIDPQDPVWNGSLRLQLQSLAP